MTIPFFLLSCVLINKSIYDRLYLFNRFVFESISDRHVYFYSIIYNFFNFLGLFICKIRCISIWMNTNFFVVTFSFLPPKIACTTCLSQLLAVLSCCDNGAVIFFLLPVKPHKHISVHPRPCRKYLQLLITVATPRLPYL